MANLDFYDDYIVAGEMRQISWALRNAHETLVDGPGLGLQQHGAAYTILTMCDKLSDLADVLEKLSERDEKGGGNG